MKKRNLGGKQLSALLLAFSLILGLTDLSSLSVWAAPAGNVIRNTAQTEIPAEEAAGEEASEGEENSGSEEASGNEETSGSEAEEFTYTGRMETSVDSQSFSLENGVVGLKEGIYERWIDRIDVPEAVLDFYAGLEEGADNDGKDDFLIEDKLYAELAKERPAITVDFVLESGEELKGKSENLFNYYTKCLSAAYCAFDRDHPEVFWLGDSWSYTSQVTFQNDNSCRLSIYFVPERAEKYAAESALKAAIRQRNTDVSTILSGAAGKSDYGKVRYFNQVLTEKNQYNTTVAGADPAGDETEENPKVDPDCWECVSALAGRTGADGPVCEGYARAFQVLCREANIPCVLVDGIAVNSQGSGPHMWNYVEMDGAWYGVDVTWNDPVGGSETSSKSELESEEWLLVGGQTFLASHPVSNRMSGDVPAFTNGPELDLNVDKYVEKATVNLSAGVYLGEASQNVFTYGDTITVKAKVSYSAGSSGVSAQADLDVPGAHQVALYYGYTQISAPVNAENGLYTMTYDTKNRQVPVGTQNLTVRFIGDDQFSWASQNVGVTLNPVKPELTVPEDQTYIYDPNTAIGLPPSSVVLPGLNETAAYSYSYAKKGENTYTDAVPALPGEYWVKVSVAADPDDFWSAAEKTFSVTIKKLTVGLNFLDSYAPDKVYDGTAPALPTADQMEITLASYDQVVFTWYRGNVAEANKIKEPTQAGTYILVATLADTLTSESAQAERKVTISKRPVNVRITDQEKTYGAKDPALTYIVDGSTPLVGEETLNGQPARTAGENVGSYAIASGTLTADSNPNYELNFIVGTFTITPAGYKTEAETVQTILAGNGEFKEPVFTGVGGEKVSGIITYQYEGANYIKYVDLVRELQKKEVGTAGRIDALFVPDAGGNYTGSTEVRIAFTVSNVTFFVGGYQASETNAVTKKEEAVYGDTWDQIIQLSDKLSAKVGGVSDSDPSHFSLNVSGYPAAGTGIPYEVLYNGVLDGYAYSDMVVCSGTIDVAPALLAWDTSGLTAQDRETRIVNWQATLSGSLRVSGILEQDKANVSFYCPADRLIGTYANTAPGNPKVTLSWAADMPVTLEGEGAQNYRLPGALPEITGRITSVSTKPVEGLASDRYLLEVEGGLSEVPAALKDNPNLNTTEKIEVRMRANVREKTPTIPDGSMAAYDIRLLVSTDGQNWVEATAENFPAEGILVTLPYPAGTGKATHDFTVAHMFTVARESYQPGDVEYPAVEKTDTGIRFRVYSLSPIEVGWLPVRQNQVSGGNGAAPQPTASPTTAASGTTSQAGNQSGTQNPTQVAGTPTGDSNPIVYLYLLFILAAGAVTCLLIQKKRTARR